MSLQTLLVKVHASDNVAVATQDITARTFIESHQLLITEHIPAGHKVALRNIAINTPVIKYGFEIQKNRKRTGEKYYVRVDTR